MRQLIRGFALLVVTAVAAGCGDGGSDNQPKVQGPPDTRIQGPAPVGGAGGNKPVGTGQPGAAVIQPK